MEYIIVALFGTFIGVSVAGYMFTTEINRKERKIANQKAMINNRDILINDQCNKLQLIKVIMKSNDLYINKIDKIKSILSNDDQSIK
ncbi:MAG: hypothetical protein ACI4UX_05810 [Clostridia bacterium]